MFATRLRSVFVGMSVATALAVGSGSAPDAMTPNVREIQTPGYLAMPDGGRVSPNTWQVLTAGTAAPGDAGPNPAAGQGIGRGCTTVWVIDEDCDGYGVGVRASGLYGEIGVGDKPDADDRDAAVNTPQTVLAKFDANGNTVLDASELKAFLAQHKGITASNIYYVSPTGDNATGAANDPSKPFRTYYHAPTGTTAVGPRKVVKPGDVVIFQAGTYVDPRVGVGQPAMASGESSKPTVVMTDPGQVVIFHSGSAISTSGAQHVIVDGFAIDNPSTPGYGHGLSFSLTQHAVFRNIEVQRVNWVNAMQDLHDILVENLVIHHNREHGLYVGTRELPSTNMTVRRNLLYRNGVSALYGGLQLNGRFTNALIEDNIIHSNGQWGITLAMGVANSRVQNNLIFNNQGHGIILQLYPGHGREACTLGTDGAITGTICPYGQTGNVFTNNTIWIGRFNQAGVVPVGGMPSLAAAVRYGLNATASDAGERQLETAWLATLSQGQNKFQNNVVVTDRGPIIHAMDGQWLDTWTVTRNVVFRDGNSDTFRNGSTPYTTAAFHSAFPLATDNVFADPKLGSTSIDFFSTPQLFNLRLQATSPAIGLGITEGAPHSDITGYPRAAQSDAGAYVFRTSTSKSPSAPTSLPIVR